MYVCVGEVSQRFSNVHVLRRGLATSTPYVMTRRSGMDSKLLTPNLISLSASLTYTTFVMLGLP
jgi:hypothetical protein